MPLDVCPLCRRESDHTTELVYRKPSGEEYYRCPRCDLIFLLPQYYVSAERERARYEEHDNNVDDPRYQNFVRPLFEEITKFCARASRGLDYGCGTGPVLTKLLNEAGYEMTLYDPYFQPNEKALDQIYDFIVSVEVVEHFYRPDLEFKKLCELLKPGGILGLMTSLQEKASDFSKWHYKSDPTHVVFYSRKTLDYICRQYGLELISLRNLNVICFLKSS